jgi:GH25 family lysozyme M1 (1,4-beta-N-acetylmuramidase)
MRSYKLISAALIAAVAILPGTVGAAAKRTQREKTRPHRTSAKNPKHRESSRKHQDVHGTDVREFERRWDAEQLEPDLPESE